MKAASCKLGFLALCSMFSMSAAAVESCGVVTIVSMLAGTRHGSMIRVSNTTCGPAGGWICLDPESEHSTAEKNKRLHALMLLHYGMNRPFALTIHERAFANACNGGYPIVEDVRAPDS